MRQCNFVSGMTMRPRRLGCAPGLDNFIPKDDGKRAAGALSRRFRTVLLGPLCLAVALTLLTCASANAADTSDGQISELAQATQNNPPKSDTASETPEQSQPPTTQQRAKPGVLEEVVVTGSRFPLAARERAQDVKIFTRADIDRSGQT